MCLDINPDSIKVKSFALGVIDVYERSIDYVTPDLQDSS